MNKIYNNLSIDNLMLTEYFNQFNKEQQEQIKIGLETNLDVSVYAKTEYNWEQMHEIRLGLEKNLDVSIYANPKYSWQEMLKIRAGLERKIINILIYAKTKYYLNKIKEKLSKKERN